MNVEVTQDDQRVTLAIDCATNAAADQIFELLERQLARGEFRFNVRRRAASNDDAPLRLVRGTDA